MALNFRGDFHRLYVIRVTVTNQKHKIEIYRLGIVSSKLSEKVFLLCLAI